MFYKKRYSHGLTKFVNDATLKRIQMFILRNIISLVSALWVATNLLINCLLVLPVSIISLLAPLPIISRATNWIVDRIYRNAVWLDSFWMQDVVGIELEIKGQPNTDMAPVVICNHQSWFDIPLVQEVITGEGPIIRFLIKREIAWIPIIGWICLILNFPRLHRSGDRNAKASDFSIIQKESKSHGNGTGALLVFPEGTRFTEGKKKTQNAPYKNLLKPKAGGLKMIQKHAAADTTLVDITIDYHQQDVNIWKCLHGNPKKITITLEHFKLSEITDIKTWLNDRWTEKDALFSRR